MRQGRPDSTDLRAAFRGKRIAFVMHPEMGHYLPALHLAKWLREAGSNVMFVGPPDLQGLVEREQLEYVTVIEQAAPRGYFEAWSRARWAAVRGAALDVPPDLQTLLFSFVASSEAETVLRRLNLDLVCADALLWPFPLVARTVGVPSVILETEGLRRVGRYLLPVDRERSAAAERERWLRMVEETRFGSAAAHQAASANVSRVIGRKYGYVTLESREPQRWSVDELLLGPRCLALDLEGEPERGYLGLSVDVTRNEDDFPWDRIGDKPIIYCSVGTNSHFYEAPERLLAAIARTFSTRRDVQLVLHTGSHVGRDDLPGLPDSAIVASQVPQLRVLERAAVFITHGGFGAIKEAIHFGVPTLVFPMFRDQIFNAAAVERLGIGIRGETASPSPPDIAAKLEGLMHGAYRGAIAALRSSIAARNEFERGVALLRSAMQRPAAARVIARDGWT